MVGSGNHRLSRYTLLPRHVGRLGAALGQLRLSDQQPGLRGIDSNFISVKTSTPYTLQAYLHGEMDPDDSAHGWQLRIRYYDANYTYLNDEDWTFASPQFGASLVGGPIYGNSLEDSVTSYGGTSLVLGGSIGAGSVDAFSSVAPTTGLVNWKFVGIASGGGIGLNPLEGHIFYAQAIYQNRISDFLTGVGQWLGLLDD